ncbi:PAS domain S-box-containing protein [Yoonia maritima]|uniref:histidine kinase n=1 Tax=Yoonia maritima TaxID=1435347 RepID=A0A2T0W3V9_9RHOB|nr:PAS domain-containing hybrid sensor histidine kinase/response regulator [Yoonia maritima]PRY80155.1 PAS domain S-box-containing protein [Yoonia maritima]
MKIDVSKQRWIGHAYLVFAGFAIMGAIAFLSSAVARDLDALASASSDNVQWTVSQTEVEFLEFTKQINMIVGSPDIGLQEMRKRFDIFYSRIDTLQSASVYRALQEQQAYAIALENVRQFLDETVPLIDSDDAVVRAGLVGMMESAELMRPQVRQIANSALDYFATEADRRRQVFATTLLQLAVLVLVLIFVLALAIYYLRRLNFLNINRRRELQEYAERMNTVIQTSLDGVIVVDSTGQILAFNAAAESMFGYRTSEVLGDTLGPLIVPEHLQAAHKRGMKRLRTGGERYIVGKGRVELEAKRSNGEVFPVELAVQSANTDAGEIFIAFVRDISANVKAEKELISARDRALAADRLKTDFLATMSHEIRTPLNGLLGNLALIQDTQLSHQQERYIRNMKTSGDLLLRHVTDVLDISRYDVGQLALREVPVNLADLIQAIVDSQSGMASANLTTVDWKWEGEPTEWVLSDPDRLQHILMNLVGNAVKFTKAGSVMVSIAARNIEADNYEVRFNVADTGQGIDEKLRSRIFDDFVTGTTAYDRTVGGTGLGLSIARRFATAMGGEITVTSVVGEGSTFSVTLPLKATEAVVDDVLEPTPDQTSIGLNILVVEDNEINRAVVRGMLHADGHTTTEVHDGAAAVEIAAEHAFDLILMDISMPIMDGRAATRAIRGGTGKCSKTPIIALTANAMANEQQAFIKDGMNGVLTKPLSRIALLEVLHRISNEIRENDPVMTDNKNQNEMREILGEEAYEQLKVQFITEVDELHLWLREVQIHELTEVAARCHKVAGSAAVFGATDYRTKLIDIENAAKADQRDKVATAVASLPEVWGSVKEWV